MTDEVETERISGKQVLCDAVTLFKDAGLYFYELGKTAVIKIKCMIADCKRRDDDKHD